MTTFTVYKLSSGEIARTVDCSDEAIHHQLLPGEGFFQGIGDYWDNYVIDGVLNEYTAEQKKLKRNKPDWSNDWCNLSMKWKDARTLSEIKNNVLAMAREQRSTKEFDLFTYNGMTFDGDLDAQRRISVLTSAAKSVIAAGHTFTKDFTLADNSVVELTAEDFVGIEMAKLWQVEAAFTEYRNKKAQIEAATTIEELEAIAV